MTQSDMQNVVPIIFIMMHAEAKNPRKNKGWTCKSQFHKQPLG